MMLALDVVSAGSFGGPSRFRGPGLVPSGFGVRRKCLTANASILPYCGGGGEMPLTSLTPPPQERIREVKSFNAVEGPLGADHGRYILWGPADYGGAANILCWGPGCRWISSTHAPPSPESDSTPTPGHRIDPQRTRAKGQHG
jgi:hypothetical protein